MKSNGSRIAWALAAFVLLCMALATAAQAAFHGRDIRRRPDMGNVDMVDTVSWYANESVRLTIEPRRGGERISIPDDATALWIVADEGGTNWIVRYDPAPSPDQCSFSFSASNLFCRSFVSLSMKAASASFSAAISASGVMTSLPLSQLTDT